MCCIRRGKIKFFTKEGWGFIVPEDPSLSEVYFCVKQGISYGFLIPLKEKLGLSRNQFRKMFPKRSPEADAAVIYGEYYNGREYEAIPWMYAEQYEIMKEHFGQEIDSSLASIQIQILKLS